MARQRDYRAEYQRRIERGLASGHSRSAARGHAPRGSFDRVFQTATRKFESGQYRSLTEAARKEHLPVEALRNYALNTGQAHKSGGRLEPGASMHTGGMTRRPSYHVPVISDGRLHEIDVSRANAKLVGEYMSAVGQFIRTGDADALEPFDGRGVTDINGQNYAFETDPETLTHFYSFQSVKWDEIYRRT